MYRVNASGSGLRSIRQRQIGGNDAFRVVARVDVHHALEAAHQQSAADEQDERDRHLRRDEDVPGETSRRPAELVASAFLQRFGGDAPERRQRRRQAERRC